MFRSRRECRSIHCVKSVRIRRFYDPCSVRMQEIRTRKTPNTNIFHAVKFSLKFVLLVVIQGNNIYCEIHLIFVSLEYFLKQYCQVATRLSLDATKQQIYLKVNSRKGIIFGPRITC